mgnify:CR=1 FL=1
MSARSHDPSDIPTYLRFMRAYETVYPVNFIVIIGDEQDIGVDLAMLLVREAAKCRVCLLKGGIDAARLELAHMLRKGSQN